MARELVIRTADGANKVFFQEGFYRRVAPTAFIHKHRYAEVHLVTHGTARFRIENTEIEIAPGDLLIIPGEVYHACSYADPDVCHCAFQIDRPVLTPTRNHIEPAVTAALLAEISHCEAAGDYTQVAAYLTLLCFSLGSSPPIPSQHVSDPGFLIHEFFSQHYVLDVRLKDLADELHLSERQAERLVIEHTGNTFRRELTRRRTEMAVYLMQNSTMSLTEIARYVGYRSYAGFWKAMQRLDADGKNADDFLQNRLEKTRRL